MGRQKLRKPRRERASVTVHQVSTPEDLAAAMAKIFPQPKTGDWRPDVLGVEKLLMQPGPDGWPLINGHRVTEEMCAAIQAERPDQAEHFVYEDIIEIAQMLGGLPQFDEPLFKSSLGECSGQHLIHRDGSGSCTRGEKCSGIRLHHRGMRECDLYGPCAFCEGPPVTWMCDRH